MSNISTANALSLILSARCSDNGTRLGYTTGRNRHGPTKIRVQYKLYDSEEALAHLQNDKIRSGPTQKYNARRDYYIEVIQQIKQKET